MRLLINITKDNETFNKPERETRILHCLNRHVHEVRVCTWCSQTKMYQGKNLNPTLTLTLSPNPNLIP